MTYFAQIDGGEGGDEEFEADSLEEAKVLATEWAIAGDWPEDGCEISISLEDEDGEKEEFSVNVPSESEKLQASLEQDGTLLAEDEGEWSTEKIYLMDGEAYYIEENGGSRGSYDRMTNDGWREYPVTPTQNINKTKARSLMLDWGYDIREVARKTRLIDN